MPTVIVRRLVGIVAALAVSLTVTLAGALPADAAKRTVWDKVAACESGGNWKINTGNGYYGGLQFSPRTWKGFGGKTYGSQAHRATKAEQIAIARRVLHGQGPGAWPTCSRKAGLTKANGKADKNAKPSTNPGAIKAKATKAKPMAPKVTAPKTVTVKSGDTIRTIAKRYDVKGGWKGLWKLNFAKLKNPNQIYVGQVLRLR